MGWLLVGVGFSGSRAAGWGQSVPGAGGHVCGGATHEPQGLAPGAAHPTAEIKIAAPGRVANQGAGRLFWRPCFQTPTHGPTPKKDVAHHSPLVGAASASSGLPDGPRALHVGLSSATIRNILKRGHAHPAHASSAPDQHWSRQWEAALPSGRPAPCPNAQIWRCLSSRLAIRQPRQPSTSPDRPLPPTAARPSARSGIMGTLAAWPADLAAASRSGRSSRRRFLSP